MCGISFEVFLDGGGEIALHDLHVVDVVLQEQVVGADSADDVERLLRVVEEKARHVAGV